MRLKVYILGLVVAGSAALAQPVAKQHAGDSPASTRIADEASCRSFVQAFYDWHVAHGANFEKTFKLKRSVLSPELGNALAADLAAAKKNADEIVGLDFDPFLNSQDPAPRYRVGKVTVKDGNCLAEIASVPPDKTRKLDATAELRMQNGKWVFVNFHYGSENGPANENLLSILQQLKRDREKTKKP